MDNLNSFDEEKIKMRMEVEYGGVALTAVWKMGA
jgi:hypothetical protein